MDIVDKKERVEIFCCYAREDQSLLLKLRAHLAFLERAGSLNVWYDQDISPGADWEKEINKHLNTAHIILLLISTDFITSEYCYSKEMMRAMERHESGEAHVIPILLRPSIWQESPFAKLQVLPTMPRDFDSKRELKLCDMIGVRRQTFLSSLGAQKNSRY